MESAAIDLESELRQIRRALRYARQERDRDFLRKKGGHVGAAEDYEGSAAKVRRLEDELQALDGALSLQKQDLATAAAAERERQRQNAKKRHDACLDTAVQSAEGIDASLAGTGSATAGVRELRDALESNLEAARAERAEFVDERTENRKMDAFGALHRAYNFGPVQDWLADKAGALGMVPPVSSGVPVGHVSRSPLAELVRGITERARKSSEREFGER